MFDRRYSSRSAVPAMKSQVSTSGTTTRDPVANANPQVLAELKWTLSQKAVVSEENPFAGVTGEDHVGGRATVCLPCRTTSIRWQLRGCGHRGRRGCLPESVTCWF